jgi:RNA polymerase sigma factor (sigma-70 family)
VSTTVVEDLLRPLVPQVLGALTRRYGHFDLAEEAVQEALLAAARQWPEQGVPDDPKAWLITVGSRRLTDLLRSEESRRRREERAFVREAPADRATPPHHDRGVADTDDTLTLLFLCCHPSLSPPSQLALTLRAVGGLTTAEIAAAFLVPEPTMGQRISRAKRTIAEAGARLTMPGTGELTDRLTIVAHVLYLMFNEGYATSSGDDLQRADLTAEAIRLTREVHALLPDEGEVAGLLSLMLLTDARRAARTLEDGSLVPLAEQDRSLWDGARIAEGVELITRTLPHGPVGPYQLQAAIAAVHDEAPTADETDWLQVRALYDVLGRIAPNPMVTLNRAVSVAMTDGPDVALAELDALDEDPRLDDHHRLHAVRAHLHELAGRDDMACREYLEAARLTRSLPERRHLQRRAQRLARAADDGT